MSGDSTPEDERHIEVAALVDRIRARRVAYDAARHYGIRLDLDHVDMSRMERMAELLVELNAEVVRREDSDTAHRDAEAVVANLRAHVESLKADNAGLRRALHDDWPEDLDEYRKAPGGEGPHALNWADKPHRLVYELIGIARAARRERDVLAEAIQAYQVDDGYAKGKEHGHAMAEKFAAERDAAEARLRTLLDAIGDPEWLGWWTGALADIPETLKIRLAKLADAAAAAVPSGDEEQP